MSGRSRSVVVIGVGNAFRGDDAVGIEVARRLADLGRQPQIEVRAHEDEGLGLLDLWDGADAVVLVDCARSGAAPGTLQRIDATSRAAPLPPRRARGHAVGVAEAIELSRALETLPRAVIAYGVEGACFEAGAELSEAVAGAVALASDAVRREALALVCAPQPR